MSVTLYWIPGQSSNAQSAINFVSGLGQTVSIMPWGVDTATQSFESTVKALAPYADEIWVRMPTNAMKVGNPFSPSGTTSLVSVLNTWSNIVKTASGKPLTGALTAQEDHYYPYVENSAPNPGSLAHDIQNAGYKSATIGGGTGAPNCDLYFVENYEPSCQQARIKQGVYAFFPPTSHTPPAMKQTTISMSTPIGGKAAAKYMCPECSCDESTNKYSGCAEGGEPTPFPTSLGSTHTGHHHHTKHDHKKWSPLYFDATSPTQASLSGEALAAYHKWYPTCTSGSCQLIPTLGVTGSNADCLINPSDVNAAIDAYKAAGGTALGLYA